MPENKLRVCIIVATRSVFGLALAFAGFQSPVEGATITLAASQDAWLGVGAGFENMTGGSDPYLYQDLGGADISAGLIEFDTNPIPTTAKVTKATLALYHIWNGQTGFYLDLFQVTAPWEESRVTGATAPSYLADPVARLLIEDADAEMWRQWDVTAIVESWVTGDQPNHGLRIERRPGPIVWPFFVPWPYIVSSEGSRPFIPTLTIEYQESPEPTTVLAGMITLVVAIAGAKTRIRSH